MQPISLMRLVKISNPNEITGSIPAEKLAIEMKWDGYLVQVCFDNKPIIYSRRGKDITENFPTIVDKLFELQVSDNSMLLGELVWFEGGEQSITTISSLAQNLPEEAQHRQEESEGYAAIIFYDILWLDGKNLTTKPFKERRRILEGLIKSSNIIILSPICKFSQWKQMSERSLRTGGEGVVIKNLDSQYQYARLDQREPKPTNTWWKWKPPAKARTDDFVVYNQRMTEKGTLMVDFGQYYENKLYHVGSIDSFSSEVQEKIQDMQGQKFVIEMGFEERTASGKLRHPNFIRIRDDKKPEDCDLSVEYAENLEVIAEAKEYPEHPQTILLKNAFYPQGLTEHMVWRHIENHKEDLLRQLKDKRVLIVVRTDSGPILRRKAKSGEDYRIQKLSDIEELNSGRVMEFHMVAEDETDLAWIDLDPKPNFNFERVKDVLKELMPIAEEFGEASIKYSGDRGFHILIQLDQTQNVDDLRAELKERLNEYVEGQSELTTDITKSMDEMRLDVSTLHYSGSIRATWSLNSKTGLISLPLELHDLDNFDKEMAIVNVPKEFITYTFKEDPNSTSGQMRWRLRDPDSFIPETFITWKFWKGIHAPGISFIIGELQKPLRELAVQAIRFNRDNWDEKKAIGWWKENQLDFDKAWTPEDWR